MVCVADEPWAFWWELVEMTRRLVLVGVFVLPVFNRGSIVQVVLGTIFCSIFLLMITQAGPYLERSDDFLANAASFSLLVFFITCTCHAYPRG